MARRQARKAKAKHRPKRTRKEKAQVRVRKRSRPASSRKGQKKTRPRGGAGFGRRSDAAKRGWETRRRRKREREAGDPWVDIDGVRIYASREVMFFYHPFAEPRSAFGTLEEALDMVKSVGASYFVILIVEDAKHAEALYQPWFDPEKTREWNPTQHRRAHSGGKKQKRTRLEKTRPDLFDL